MRRLNNSYKTQLAKTYNTSHGNLVLKTMRKSIKNGQIMLAQNTVALFWVVYLNKCNLRKETTINF